MPAARVCRLYFAGDRLNLVFATTERRILTTRGTKRDSTNRFKVDVRFDILDDGKPIGQLVCALGAAEGTLTFDNNIYTIAPVNAGTARPLYQRVLGKIAWDAKPAGQPLALKDRSGQVLALAQRVRSRCVVGCGVETFVLRRPFLSPRTRSVVRTTISRLVR